VDWKARVELFEQLRQEHEFGVGTIAGVAAKFGVHRRMVRQAVAGAVPPVHRYPARVQPKLGPVAAFIDKILDEDRRAPRKQRHTARRIYRRILTEFPDAAVAESTVRNHVRARKHAMGLIRRETFVPQSYNLGVEAQVDWYEAWADLGGERTRLQVFAMRSMASGAAFHRAYPHATQQAFLEAHEHAFAYFGGVFRLLRYDNLASAVRKILRGYRREETIRFVAFRSHWRFAAEFCTPGEDHEKGVALKAVSAAIANKTEAGAVRANIQDAAELKRAAGEMKSRLGDQITGFIAQPMAKGVGEAILGYRRDPLVGPVVALGAGGVLAEVYRDVVLRLAPARGYRGLPKGTSRHWPRRLPASPGWLCLQMSTRPKLTPSSCCPRARAW
jgi:transposase